MKKLQKVILSLLLLTFAFIIVHDYVILDVNQNFNYEYSLEKSDSKSLDIYSSLHESVHNLLFEALDPSPSSYILASYQKYIQEKDFFISQIGTVLQQPPLL